jgi:hypothetical protein
MEAVRTSETLVDNHFTRQYNPEDSSEQLCSFPSYLQLLSVSILKYKGVCEISGSHDGEYDV